MLIAYRKVISNKGASGVDGVTVEEIKDYVNQNWKNIKKQIETRNYRPQPVKRVEIPKLNGGIRKLGIPTIMDRIIQQAMVQKLEPICEPYFSDYLVLGGAVVREETSCHWLKTCIDLCQQRLSSQKK